jgi:hypothetical protein
MRRHRRTRLDAILGRAVRKQNGGAQDKDRNPKAEEKAFAP